MNVILYYPLDPLRLRTTQNWLLTLFCYSLFIYLLAIFMQADPVQLQAGLNGGLLRTY